MGLLEKLKNTFFEEEYVEVDEPERQDKVAKKVDVKEIKKAKKVKPVEEKVIVEEEIEEVKEEPLIPEKEDITLEEKETYSDRDLVNKSNKLTMFDDDDFEPTKQIPVIVEEKYEKKIYGETVTDINSSINISDLDKYNHTSHMAYGASENKFQPTPIISPIYGILDKNYRKEEVIDKKDKPSSYVSRKNADLDSIRRKAYGDVSIMDNYEEEGVEEVKEIEPSIYEIDESPKPVVGEVTVGDAEEYFSDLGLEYNVDYKDKQYETAVGRRSDIHHDIDSFENDGVEEVIISDNYEDNNTVDNEENITLDDLINRNRENNVEDTANLEDNLFDLVDSMYEGGE